MRTFICVWLVVLVTIGHRLQAAEGKPRLLVLTDIGGDPDDQQSLVRLMHYANEFQIEGLIASASGTPGELKEQVTKPELIREIVEAYGKVQPNLAKHAPGFPPAAALLRVIKSGNARRGVQAVGQGKDTEGSKWIVAAADKAADEPLNIAIWGGQTDLAQALWRVRQDRGAQGLKTFADRTRIYDIGDQDGIAEWIWKEFPGLFYVLAKAPKGADKREGAYRGMYLGGDDSFLTREWMERNIRQNHGPLAALYPARTWTAPNPHSGIKEGDTPSWFYFLRNGLNDAAHPEWGGWGGRFTNAFDRVYRDAADRVTGNPEARATVWRWRPAFQNDFQARLDWAATSDPAKANHAPKITINGQAGLEIVRITARPGESVKLAAELSDPDGNDLTINWHHYPEAGTYPGVARVRDNSRLAASVEAPETKEPVTIHVICEATDNGTPKLRTNRRVAIEIRP